MKIYTKARMRALQTATAMAGISTAGLMLPGVAGAQAAMQAPAQQAQDVSTQKSITPVNVNTMAKSYTVPSGTRILLALKSEVSTATVKPGDPVYCVTEFPVVQDGAVIIPSGTFVRGVVDTLQRPGRVKGRAQLQMHFTTLVYPNGVQIALNAPLENAPATSGARVVNQEGTVKQNSAAAHDVLFVGETSSAGAGMGALASIATSSPGMSIGVGAGAGAAAGLAYTLFTRGKDIVFAQGTAIEMTLARPVNIQAAQLNGMTAYTGNIPPAQP